MKGKVFYLALISTLMFILSISVYAEEGRYTPGVNSYTNSIVEGARTVIIYRGEERSDITGEDIYYIGQNNDTEGFSDLEMLMKLDAPAGDYTLLTNGGKSTTFTISAAQAFVSGSTEMKFLGAQMQSDHSYSVAFGLDLKKLYRVASRLTMIIGDKAYTTDMFGDDSIIKWIAGPMYSENEQGEKELLFAIQIDGVGAEYITTDESGNITPNFTLYFK